MNFTNEDLKRLEDSLYVYAHSDKYFTYPKDMIKALVNRLNKSETVSREHEESLDVDHVTCDESCTEGWDQREALKAVKAWRESKGEKGS